MCGHGRVCLGLGLVRVATASGLFAPVSSSTAFSAATPGGPAFSMTKCGLPALSPGRVRSHTALLSAQRGGWAPGVEPGLPGAGRATQPGSGAAVLGVEGAMGGPGSSREVPPAASGGGAVVETRRGWESPLVAPSRVLGGVCLPAPGAGPPEGEDPAWSDSPGWAGRRGCFALQGGRGLGGLDGEPDHGRPVCAHQPCDSGQMTCLSEPPSVTPAASWVFTRVEGGTARASARGLWVGGAWPSSCPTCPCWAAARGPQSSRLCVS